MKVDLKTRGTRAPGLRLVLLASLFVMVLLADMPIASAAPGGAAQEVVSPPGGRRYALDRWSQFNSGLPVTGIFGNQTRAAVRAFQASEGLPADGVIAPATWGSLLNFDPVRPRWAGRRAKRRGQGGATASRALPPRRPLSASLPARADEIDPGPAP